MLGCRLCCHPWSYTRHVNMLKPASHCRCCPKLWLVPVRCSFFKHAECVQVEVVNVSAATVGGTSVTVQSYTVSRQGTRAGSAGCWEVADIAANSVMEAGQRCDVASGEGVTLLFLWLHTGAAQLLSRNVYWIPNTEVPIVHYQHWTGLSVRRKVKVSHYYSLGLSAAGLAASKLFWRIFLLNDASLRCSSTRP